MRPFLQGNLLLLASVMVDCMPYILLKNKAPKCYQVIAPINTLLIIKYHAPDMVDLDRLQPSEKAVAEGEERKSEGGEEHKLEEGPDVRFNERLLKRIETLKRANVKDINISITPRDSSGMMITSPLEHGGNIPSKKRIQLESKEGSYEYDSANFEGTVEICIQSYTASAENPSKVGFSVEPQSEKDEIEKLIAAERKLTSGKLEKLEAEQKVVAEETSRITYELARMQRRAKSIAVDAHFSKQREETFHYQSISLSRAVRNWPIARIVVLCLAGYMQLTHVVKFMKSRHIY